MKVLTLWEPWATLLVHGVKVFETRSWPTSYRGPLLIHAAKRWGDDQKALCSLPSFRYGLSVALQRGPEWMGWPPAENRGCIIGQVELVDCFEITREVREGLTRTLGLQGALREGRLGDWTDGRYAWKFLINRAVWSPPAPARGRQRIWEYDVREGAEPEGSA